MFPSKINDYEGINLYSLGPIIDTDNILYFIPLIRSNIAEVFVWRAKRTEIAFQPWHLSSWY